MTTMFDDPVVLERQPPVDVDMNKIIASMRELARSIPPIIVSTRPTHAVNKLHRLTDTGVY